MAKITPNSQANSNTEQERKERPEQISEGSKICVMLGHFFEQRNGYKKLHIGYAIIEEEQPSDPNLSETGMIHIDGLLIKDSVMWKHQKWSGGCGYREAYDNENHDDITKIILSCEYVRCDFAHRHYEWNGENRLSIEIKDWAKIEGKETTEGLSKLIRSCEESFEKIIDYRKNRGDQISRPTKRAVMGNNDQPSAEDQFDQFVNDHQQGHNEIPF